MAMFAVSPYLATRPTRCGVAQEPSIRLADSPRRIIRGPGHSVWTNPGGRSRGSPWTGEDGESWASGDRFDELSRTGSSTRLHQPGARVGGTPGPPTAPLRLPRRLPPEIPLCGISIGAGTFLTGIHAD